MSYLIQNDFKKLIQSDNLSAILGSDFTILDQAQRAAITEVTSYLTQKYDCSQEFTDTNPWDPAVAYKANARVYLDASIYNSANTYNVNDLCLQNGSVYICINAGTTGAFDLPNWTLLGIQYAIFYATIPNPVFNAQYIYAVGNTVFWKDNVYTCVLPTLVTDHTLALQFGSYANLPQQNVFPDDTLQGLKYWGTPVPYSVPAGTLPTDTTKWTLGDNRNPQMVNSCIDVALFTIHSRIAPNNIPDLRVKRYDDVIKWLKDVAKGEYVTANLTKFKPKKGKRKRGGRNTTKLNDY